MRYSRLFGRTTKDIPHDSDSVNARYLTQGGFIDKVAAGIYNYLPLGQRVLEKVKRIIREEMNAVDGQEVLLPSLHPIELWETTGRSRTADEILYRTKGAGNKDFVLAPSHEEAVTPLAKRYVQSYKDLPLSLYQIATKFRNEPRAKSGILRGREFGMKDMYSFHTSDEDLDAYYEKVKEAYLKVYRRCGLDAYVVEASGGIFSDKFSHEFSVATPAGEDTILLCHECKSAQNLEVATGKVVDPLNADGSRSAEEAELPMQEVPVKRGFTIEENAKAHHVPPWKILKTVVYKVLADGSKVLPDGSKGGGTGGADESGVGAIGGKKKGKRADQSTADMEGGGFVGVVIRGDLAVNEMKLVKYLGKNVVAAAPEELESLGLVRGFISPVGLQVKGTGKQGDRGQGEAASLAGARFAVIADHSIKNVKNFVTGANKPNTDLANVNLGRDFTVSDFTDLVAVNAGFECGTCGEPLREIKAVEAGNIFKLGTKYSRDFELYYTDENGKQKLPVMGCYGIGTTRLVGTVVEASHDDKGIIWPLSIAPFQVHLVTIGPEEQTRAEADKLYSELTSAGVEVLYDDRDESAGKKLNDADLIGVPLRIVISKRVLAENSVEWKLRSEREAGAVPLKDIQEKTLSWIMTNASQ